MVPSLPIAVVFSSLQGMAVMMSRWFILINTFSSARAVQARRRETGPLSPDHLREAYRAYQEETGHVGAARPLRAKKLFVR